MATWREYWEARDNNRNLAGKILNEMVDSIVQAVGRRMSRIAVEDTQNVAAQIKAAFCETDKFFEAWKEALARRRPDLSFSRFVRTRARWMLLKLVEGNEADHQGNNVEVVPDPDALPDQQLEMAELGELVREAWETVCSLCVRLYLYKHEDGRNWEDILELPGIPRRVGERELDDGQALADWFRQYCLEKLRAALVRKGIDKELLRAYLRDWN